MQSPMQISSSWPLQRCSLRSFGADHRLSHAKESVQLLHPEQKEKHFYLGPQSRPTSTAELLRGLNGKMQGGRTVVLIKKAERALAKRRHKCAFDRRGIPCNDDSDHCLNGVMCAQFQSAMPSKQSLGRVLVFRVDDSTDHVVELQNCFRACYG